MLARRDDVRRLGNRLDQHARSEAHYLWTRDDFTGDGVQTHFVLSHVPRGAIGVMWFQETLLMPPGKYTQFGLDLITLNRAPANASYCSAIYQFDPREVVLTADSLLPFLARREERRGEEFPVMVRRRR